jgi:hypothetical protein
MMQMTKKLHDIIVLRKKTQKFKLKKISNYQVKSQH